MSEKERLVSLPAVDKIMGVWSQLGEVEIQWKSAGPPHFPKPEDIGPDSRYAVRLSLQQALVLAAYLDQVRASIRKP